MSAYTPTALDDARDDIRSHLAVVCFEFMEWNEKSILRDGHVRRIANEHLRKLDAADRLMIVKKLATDLAMEAVIEEFEKKTGVKLK